MKWPPREATKRRRQQTIGCATRDGEIEAGMTVDLSLS